MKFTHIYALVEPGGSLEEPHTVRYIGKSNNPSHRLRNHIWYAKNGGGNNPHRARWIGNILRRGEEPECEVIEVCHVHDWPEREKYWIKRYREYGASLTNIQSGGAPETSLQRINRNIEKIQHNIGIIERALGIRR